MSEDRARDSFDTLWSTLALEHTAQDMALDATIKPAGPERAPSGEAPTQASDGEASEAVGRGSGDAPLPLITLGEAAAADGSTDGAELRVLSTLGEGGMGRVQLVRQRALDRDVALKTLRPGVQDAHVVSSLLREARITGQLEHPNIVPVHALGRDDSGRPVLLMKRVDGVCWRDLIAGARHPAWDRLETLPDDRIEAHVQILMHVCNAVHFAHTRGVVHRDIKPDNVMVGEFGEVYLLDWGIATRLQPVGGQPAEAGGGLVGTPAYMAPEMVGREVGPVSERTDVYLLGASLHEALTGRPRHDGSSAHAVLLSAYESAPIEYGDEAPAELAAICNRATATRPEDRYDSARALYNALAGFLRHRSSALLTEAIRPRIEELTGRIAETEPEAHGDAQEIERLFSECRFGLLHALREWPENEQARAGLQRALEAMIEHRLARENVDAAEGLLSELPEPRPELEERVARQRDALARRRQEHARLREMADELDVTVSTRERVAFFGALALFLGGETAALVWMRMGSLYEPSHAGSIGFVALCVLFLLAAIRVGRKSLLRNTINRRIVWSVVVWSCAALVTRVLSAVLGIAVAHALLFELLVLAAGAAGAAITLAPWLGWLAVIFGLALAVGLSRPGWAPELVMAASTLALATAAFFWRRPRESRASG